MSSQAGYTCITISKSLPIPLVAHESQLQNENGEEHYLTERAGHCLQLPPRIQIACHCPFNTLKHPHPPSPQRMSTVEITPRDLKKKKKNESLPGCLASLCTQMRGAAFQREDSQGSLCPANFSYLPHSLKRNTKMERSDFAKILKNVVAEHRNTSTKHVNKSDFIISE